jgi:hypothetical protein
MENLLMNDSVTLVPTSIPTCLHPGCPVQGDLNLGECGLCRQRMCGFHDCDCPIYFASESDRLEYESME